jgi:small subunit ribosomal protein S6
MNSYELMVIFTPVLSNEEFNAATKNLKKYIGDHQGEIVGEDSWGLKSLAYPIAKKTTGLYYVMEYQADASLNAKFTIQMNRDESIMRFMITALDKHAIAYNDRKRKGIKIEKPAPAAKETADSNETLNTLTETES